MEKLIKRKHLTHKKTPEESVKDKIQVNTQAHDNVNKSHAKCPAVGHVLQVLHHRVLPVRVPLILQPFL